MQQPVFEKCKARLVHYDELMGHQFQFFSVDNNEDFHIYGAFSAQNQIHAQNQTSINNLY
jgi:hypothetical protein